MSRLTIELTERCNNNCIHCYINLPADDPDARKQELSTEEIKEILREAASLDYLTVRFTGGEPLLRDDFEELYCFARKLGLQVIISTNATLISPHIAEVFSRISPLKEISITVYGMSKESYEAVTRNPGSFDAAWRGINLLLEKEVPFTVRWALLPPNKEETKEFEEWAATIPWVKRLPKYSMFFDLRARRDSEKKNRLIEGLRVSPEEGLGRFAEQEEKYWADRREFCSKFLTPPNDSLFRCGAGLRSGGCVDAYGRFQPCTLLRHPDVVYNLKSGPIKDARENFFPKMRRMKASNPEYLNRCAKCFLKGLCEQCPAKSWMEHGTLDTPVEYLCEIAHTEARTLGLIEDDENAWEVEDWKARIREFSETEPNR